MMGYFARRRKRGVLERKHHDFFCFNGLGNDVNIYGGDGQNSVHHGCTNVTLAVRMV